MSQQKRISILGSTGSIGVQTLDVIRQNPDMYKVTALACSSSIKKMAEQIQEFHPSYVSVSNKDDADKLQLEFPNVKFYYGKEGLITLSSKIDFDMLVNSLVGMIGLEPTYHALKQNRNVSLANKETLVAGGKLIMSVAAEKAIRILPIDSEHSAIFQCLQGNENNIIKNILLTASGGPFRGYNKEQLKTVTKAQSLAHPKWNMGQKISIDSATMMNKGFEVIEAKWLFGAAPEQIKVLVHPESIIHSMVEYEDNAIIAQLGITDMRIPISYALSYPLRHKNTLPSLNLSEISKLTFEEPDIDTFSCLKMAYQVLKEDDTYSTVLNAANEICVSAFLNEMISFLDIQNIIEKVLNQHNPGKSNSLEEILTVDNDTRIITRQFIKEINFTRG